MTDFFLKPDPLTGIVKPTPLVDLKYFGLVTGVPCESMHTLYQLVCKNFFDGIIVGRYLNARVPAFVGQPGSTVTYRSILDSRIALCQALCPDEFQRKVSTTTWLPSWKATEHRQFWVYLIYPMTEDLLTLHPAAHNDELLKLIRYVILIIHMKHCNLGIG
jgi:hypothetical protein